MFRASLDRMDRRAMRWLNGYVDNAIRLSITRRLNRTNVRSVHCGMRAVWKSIARMVSPR